MKILLAFLLSIFLISLQAQEDNSKNLDLYLLVGQSNMAGRGVIESQDTVGYTTVLTLTKDLKWVPARDPIHFDKKEAGTGLGRTFGIIMAQSSRKTIGLIPCAVGGTSIDLWKPGAFDQATKTHPWDDMVKRVQFAMQYGQIKGILWHQGESDSNPAKCNNYGEKLTDLIGWLRQLTGDQNTPFVCGEPGTFFKEKVRGEGNKIGPADRVAAETKKVAKNDSHAAFVSGKGLTHKGDKTHFDAQSLRELGRRYARAMQKILR